MSKWFKYLLCISFFIYIGFWLFTIYLANIQKQRNLEPVLPVVPQDSEEYRNLAESLIQHHSFAQNGVTDTLRSPGYPTFVAFFKTITGSYFAVTLAQILLVFLSALVIRKLGILFHSIQAGEIAAAIFLFYPLTLTLSLIVLTDIFFLFLFLSGFYFILSKKNIILASLLFAVAIYARPMGIFALPIFLAPILVSESAVREKIKSTVIMILIVLLAVSPWVYRNYKLTGVADFTSFKAINLAYYAVPLYLANANHTTLDNERANLENKLGLSRGKWSDLKYSNTVSSAAEKIILENLPSYLKFHIFSSLPFLFSSSIQDTLVTYQNAMHLPRVNEPGAVNFLVSRQWKLFFQSISRVSWKIGERIIWILVYIIASFGFWKNRRNPLAYAFLFIPAYLMLLAGPAANARYALQGFPFILLLFSSGMLSLTQRKNVQK